MWGTSRIGCGDSGLRTGIVLTLTDVPLAMESARTLLEQFADQRQQIGSPPSTKARRPESKFRKELEAW